MTINMRQNKIKRPQLDRKGSNKHHMECIINEPNGKLFRQKTITTKTNRVYVDDLNISIDYPKRDMHQQTNNSEWLSKQNTITTKSNRADVDNPNRGMHEQSNNNKDQERHARINKQKEKRQETQQSRSW